MKKIIIAITFMISVFSGELLAKDVLTKAAFKVSGNCEMCKERIEKAAKINGVKTAIWSEDQKIISVVFAPSKTSADSIKQSIANAGYDTDSIKANDGAYKKLPQCCQYR